MHTDIVNLVSDMLLSFEEEDCAFLQLLFDFHHAIDASYYRCGHFLPKKLAIPEE